MNRLIQYRTPLRSNSSLFTLLLLVIFSLSSCTQSKEKRPSPFRSDSIRIGNASIKIEYSSPRVKGRKIFGLGDSYLIQYSEVWRTGANEATVLSVSQDIKLDSFLLPKGKYALFTVPGPKTWEIIVNKEWDQWGSYYRKESLDVLKFKIPAENFTSSEENMTFGFLENALVFKWANVGWKIPISSI